MDNLKASHSLVNISLHDKAEMIRTTSMWLRNKREQNQTVLPDGQNKTTSNRYIMQIGGDVLRWDSGKVGKTVVGVMGGYNMQHGNTHNRFSGYSAKNSVKG